MNDGPVHSIEDLVHDELFHGYGTNRDESSGKGLGHQNHVRLDIPVIDRPEFARPADSGLNFIRNKKGSVLRA